MLSNHSVRNSINVNIKDMNGWTLFHGACENGQNDFVQPQLTWRAQPMGHR